MSSRITSLVVAVCILSPGLASNVNAQNRVAFVTSASGTADLSSWPEASDGLSGLDAADSICVNLAEAAGLANHLNFVAWMSDSVDDAYCRVHRFAGKKSANCGEAELPVAAGPWVRTDGVPFSGPIEDLLPPTHEVYTSLHFDENGVSVPLTSFAWTGTGDAGSLFGNTCSDWTSTAAETVQIGWTDRTSVSWGSFGTTVCWVETVHLYCLESLPGPPVVLPDPPGRLAFATTVTGNGDLDSWPEAASGTTGIDAGNSICNNRAEAAGLPNPGSYKAWLSDATTNASDRFAHDGPWFRPDGFQIASGIADLTDGALFTSIHQDETGDYLTNTSAWTGTNADGTANAEHCDSWNSTSGNGRGGRVNAVSGDWTEMDSQDCSQTNSRLYCLSDYDPLFIFGDGFESHEP